MAIVSLKKATITALIKDRDKILSALQEYGNMHIAGVDNEDELYFQEFTDTKNDIDELSTKLQNVKATIKDLSPYDDREKPMLTALPEMSLEELDNILLSSDNAYSVVKEHMNRKNDAIELRSEILRYESSISQISPWRNLEVDVADLVDTDTTRIMVGTVPVLDFPEFSSKIDEIEFAEHEKIYSDRDNVYILLMYHNKSNEQVHDAQFVHSFSKSNFPFEKGTPSAELKNLKKEIAKLKVDKEKLEDEEKSRVKHLTELEQLHDALSIKLNLLKQVESFGGTEYVFVLEGYIPGNEEKKLKKALDESAGDNYQLDLVDAEGDDVPTVFDNNKAVAPFESVTNMFATSKRDGFDPNVLMAPFFALFFGMMLSDAGYGIILSLGAAVVYFRTRNSQGKGNSLLAVLAISGVSTIFWGIMFGGFMGFDTRELMGIEPVLFNPLQSPILTLGLSLLLGIIQIVVGMLVKTITMIKRGRLLEALGQQISWIALLVGLVMFAYPMCYMFIGESAPAWAQSLGDVGLVVAGVGLVLLLLLGGYGQKGFGRIFGGVSSLMDITSYLSDILSYARLFGLGLATGVIGMVVNTIAKMLTGGGVVGWIFAVVVFIAVHLFNLAINALGAYVHSSRLQYVEFFGKFFEDGGVKYVPFEPETKYYNIKKINNN